MLTPEVLLLYEECGAVAVCRELCCCCVRSEVLLLYVESGAVVV